MASRAGDERQPGHPAERALLSAVQAIAEEMAAALERDEPAEVWQERQARAVQLRRQLRAARTRRAQQQRPS